MSARALIGALDLRPRSAEDEVHLARAMEQGKKAQAIIDSGDYDKSERARLMRAIAAGLRLPELNAMTVEEVATRVVTDHERRSGARVDLDARVDQLGDLARQGLYLGHLP